MNSIVEAKYME